MSDPTSNASIDHRNEQLFARYAKPGVIGLAGGAHFVDRTIRKVQRNWQQRQAGAPRSLYSHAFICSGLRADGQHWVLESDLAFRPKQMRLGVQENRASKYFSALDYPNLALLDFELSVPDTQTVMRTALDLLAGLTSYSLRELIGTLLALQRPGLRHKDNLLARDGALYCSAMVQHCYHAIGLEFASGVSTKNTMPEDIAATPLPHQKYAVIRAER
jgi:hypothetical protein